jgi:hypothetical protein
MKLMMKKILKRMGLLLFSVGVELIFLELLLQIAGFSLSVLQKKRI